eukprot:CAMPEP_0114996930 /NCGR_PEP_ID=MMETSP0216-20121206/14605_1 /TAXON_ID=223996 /ORGANISM="Protocruzia adherens, Strain Boccale" /LENGTH=430 /DNA_ID=CAMNT_0002361231 /DNA_START=31 /DNA_END=1323 /DNA_ORIENTATION=+
MEQKALILFVLGFLSATHSLPVDTSIELTKGAFGSCWGMLGKEGEIIQDVVDYDPQLWLWLGDVVYADRFPLGPSGKTRVKSLYDEHRKYPPYDELTTKSQITGIWDDHDFNQNNGDKYNPTKEWVQQMFLDFLDEPKDSARRSQPGLYTSFQYGSGDRSVRLIFIDIRYFADSRFFDGPNVDLLGEEQWTWLENELKTTTATFNFLISGTQLLPDDRIIQENPPVYTRDRLLKLLSSTGVQGLVILSGDVHFAEFLKTPCNLGGMKYPLYEFTSSGMSHTFHDHAIFGDYFLEGFFPRTYTINRIVEKNFGTFEFDWSDVSDPSVSFAVKTLGGQDLMRSKIQRSQIVDQPEGKREDHECDAATLTGSQRFYGNIYNHLSDTTILGYYLFVINVLALLVFLVCFMIYYPISKVMKYFKNRSNQLKIKIE